MIRSANSHSRADLSAKDEILVMGIASPGRKASRLELSLRTATKTDTNDQLIDSATVLKTYSYQQFSVSRQITHMGLDFMILYQFSVAIHDSCLGHLPGCFLPVQPQQFSTPVAVLFVIRKETTYFVV